MTSLKNFLARDLVQLKNVSWLGIDNIYRAVIGFAVSVLIARHLGPDGFGIYAYVFSVIGLFVPLTVFGLENVTVRHLVSLPEKREATLGSSLLIRTLGGLAAFGLAVAFPLVVSGPEAATPALMALAALVLIAAPSEALNGVFRAEERMGWIAVPKSIMASVTAVIAAILVWAGTSLTGLVLLRGVEAILIGVATGLALRRFLGGFPRLRIDPAKVGVLLRAGLPLFLSAVSVTIYMRVDQIMLGAMAAEAELGHYAVAVKFTETVYFVPMALGMAYYTGLVRSHDTAPARFEAETQAFYDIAGLSALALTVIVALGALILVVPAFGAAFAPAIPIAIVLAPSVIFASLGVARSNVLTILGWNWTTFATTSSSAVLNVGLNFLLIPPFGGIGAAVATLISYGFAVIGCCFLLPWMRPTGWALIRALNPLGALSRLRQHAQQTEAEGAD